MPLAKGISERSANVCACLPGAPAPCSMPGPGADLCTITHSKCSEHIESYESISGYKWTWWYSRSSCKRRT
eukprot:100937-Pelagomonas_calceolata.AAC.5